MLLEKSSDHAINQNGDSEGRAELNMKTQSLKKMQLAQKKTSISEVILDIFFIKC